MRFPFRCNLPVAMKEFVVRQHKEARERVVERGDKPGFYVVVSRAFIRTQPRAHVRT